MKNFFAIAFTFIFASALFVGCGFVDDNPGAASFDEGQQIESINSGSYAAKVDTTGFDIPG